MFLYYKFLHFQLALIFEMEEESWILLTSMPGNIETLKIDSKTKILEDLGAVIYDIINVLENFGNGLKQLNEITSKRKEKLETLFMVSLNIYEGNIQQEYAIFEPNEIDKLKEEIHGLN